MINLMSLCTASISTPRIVHLLLILDFQRVESEQGKVKVSLSNPGEIMDITLVTAVHWDSQSHSGIRGITKQIQMHDMT